MKVQVATQKNVATCNPTTNDGRDYRISLLAGLNGLDDLEPVPIKVTKREHRRHAWPSQNLVRADPVLKEVCMQCIGVDGAEPDARLDLCRRLGLGGDQGDRRAAIGWGDLDPSPAAAHL